MNDSEIAGEVFDEDVLDGVSDMLSRMSEVVPGVNVVAKSLDLNSPTNEREYNALSPKSAFVVGLNMSF